MGIKINFFSFALKISVAIALAPPIFAIARLSPLYQRKTFKKEKREA